MEKIIKFKKLHPNAELPTYAHDGDIGMDVRAVGVEYDEVHDVYIYHTGLACETEGHMGVLGMMKSSIYKHGEAYLTNGVGLIDSDQYRGEICYVYRNRTSFAQRALFATLKARSNRSLWYRLTHSIDEDIEFWQSALNPYSFAPYNAGDCVGQLVPLTFDKVKIKEVDELSETERGTGGFGSSEASKRKPIKKKKTLTEKIKE